MSPLRCPLSGAALAPDTAHSLSDGRTRWPVVDSIPFLRAGREELRARALACLDEGDAQAALCLLLADQDDWWRGPTAQPDALRRLVRERERLTLREAMSLLDWGPVADYFAHRWTDPVYLAGLALMQAHWNEPADCFELACGIGHYLRALAGQGVRAAGGDVVFAKLWIARHYIAPDARLLCFDAAHPWPIGQATFDLVACHDGFYFLEPKREIGARLRAGLSRKGVLAISHVHNREWPNLSAGSAVSKAELAALFPGAALYDDAELTQAAIERRAPSAGVDAAVEAFSLAAGPGLRPARNTAGPLTVPPAGAALRRNPLYGADGRITWPSERYAHEYGPRATYPSRTTCPPSAMHEANTADWALRRELVDLPERW